jgi:predicted Ser/Thr protein kinase
LTDEVRRVSPTNETLASTATPMVAPPPFTHLGRYRIVQLIGQGGMGAVYRAHDDELDRPVALKVMLPGLAQQAVARERFVREARAAAKITSDHVVTIYEVGTHAGVPFIAMEYLHGQPLDAALQAQTRFTLSHIVRLGAEVAAGLADAHALGLVHRDIKPANLWLDAHTGRVKLLDFGLARPTDATEHLTASGAIVGTPAFMSPEQARSGALDGRSDVFSLGAVLYHLLTGRLPFHGESVMAILTALAVDEPVPIRQHNPHVPELLARLVEQMLAKDPTARPASARAVESALRALLPTTAPLAVPVTDEVLPPPTDSYAADTPALTRTLPPPARPTRWRWAWVGFAALAVTVLAGIVVIVRDKDGKEIGRLEVPPGGTIETKETPAVVPPPAVVAEPFTLLRAGQVVRRFRFASGAFAERQAGDLIEVRGPGPYVLPVLEIDAKGLHLRAAADARPVFVMPADAPMGAAWLTVLAGAKVELDGCRFQVSANEHRFLLGAGNWTLRRCVVTVPDGHNPAMLLFSGERLQVADSLLVGLFSHGTIGLGEQAQAEFRNCLIYSGAYNFFSLNAGSANVSFERCSLLLNGGLVGLGTEVKQLQVRLKHCLVETSHLLQSSIEREKLRGVIQWHGADNAYHLRHHWAVFNSQQNQPVSTLAEWNQLWGNTEQNVRQLAEPVLPLSAWAWPTERAVPVLRTWASDTTAGPDWDQVGAGAAYGRVLGAKPKPQPLEGGPIVLQRPGQPERGFLDLTTASGATQAGDTLELRTDTPTGTLMAAPVPLTVRAAPGYAPMLAEAMRLPVDGWSFAGIHFSKELRIGASQLTNCSAAPGVIIEGQHYRAGQRTVLERCWLPFAQFVTTETGSVRVAGSVVRELSVGTNDGGQTPKWTFQLHRSFLGGPLVGHAAVQMGVGSVEVQADECVLLPMVCRGAKGTFRWAGDRNVYLSDVPLRSWAWEVQPMELSYRLVDWRKQWNSDLHSTERTVPYLSPQHWRVANRPTVGADVASVASLR